MKKLMLGAVLVAAVSMLALPVSAQDGADRTWQISLTPGIHLPIGDLADDFEDDGLDAGMGFSAGLTAQRYLGEDILDGNVSLLAGIDYFLIAGGEEDFGPFTVDADGSAWGFTGGGRYSFFGDRDWTPYVQAAVGIYMVEAEISVEGPGVDLEVSDDETAFGFNIGGGLDWLLTDSIAVGPQVRYHHALTDADFAAIEVGLAISYIIE